MKKLLGFALITLVLGLPAFAQSQNIPYVDIATAQNEVDTLKKEIDTLTADNDKLKKDNEALRSAVATNQQQLNEIAPIIDNVRQKGIELADVLVGISDKDMRTKAQESITKNRDLERRLNEKKTQLERDNSDKGRAINSNQKSIDTNETKIQKNQDRKALLEAAIAKTKDQQAKLTKYMSDVDTFLTNAETVLKK